MELEEALYRRLADGQVHDQAGLAAALGCSARELRSAAARLAALGLELARVPAGWRLAHRLEPLDGATLRGALARPLAALEVCFAIDSTSLRLARTQGAPATAPVPRASSRAAPGPSAQHSGLTGAARTAGSPGEPGAASAATDSWQGRGGVPGDAPAACLAEAQTGGRGRRGRTWRSPLGAGIYLSLAAGVARPAGELGGLSLALGVGAAEALEPWAPGPVGLKWPNDLVLGGAKLGGILVESVPHGEGCRVIAGIGVNLRLPGAERAALGRPVAELGPPALAARNRIAAALIDAFGAALERFAGEGFAAFAARWAARDVARGREVLVTGAGEALRGTACGVDGEGALLVRSGAATQAVRAGEISLRLAP